jgi:hypothetical protein
MPPASQEGAAHRFFAAEAAAGGHAFHRETRIEEELARRLDAQPFDAAAGRHAEAVAEKTLYAGLRRVGLPDE